MNYLVAVLADRIQAEAAYSALEKENFLMEKVTILGKGYKTADEYGLIDPQEQARKGAKLMAFWLVPFGFFAGTTFSLITGLQTFAWAGEIGNHVVGGLAGAIAGAMGSIAAGGGIGLIIQDSDAVSYRDRLKAGKYLIAVKGSPLTIQQANSILKRLNPESLQDYVDLMNT